MDTLHVVLDGHVHEMGAEEHTVCGLPVPHGSPTTSDPVDCPQETKKSRKTTKER